VRPAACGGTARGVQKTGSRQAASGMRGEEEGFLCGGKLLMKGCYKFWYGIISSLPLNLIFLD